MKTNAYVCEVWTREESAMSQSMDDGSECLGSVRFARSGRVKEEVVLEFAAFSAHLSSLLADACFLPHMTTTHIAGQLYAMANYMRWRKNL